MRHALRRLAAGLVLAVALTSLLPVLPLIARGPVKVVAREVATSVDRQRLIQLPIEASHVALHWTGEPDAHLTIAFGESPSAIGEEVPVGVDEDAGSGDGETYSAVLWTGGARFARVTTDRPLGHLTLAAIDSRDTRIGIHLGPSVTSAATTEPQIVSRADWGANESYRFDGGGHERFAPGFFPLQKMIVHHTAGRNNDPDPEATIRAIYYDHAVLRGYGDIDYNFLIDAQGRVYEGRHSREYAPGEPITTEDLAGNQVRGSHARDFNDGTVGIVLLGTFTNVQPTAAARSSLIRLLAWKAEAHGIDPKGKGLYVNPQLGNSKILYNISGHRDVNATACPGDAFYATFPQLRQQVADYIASTTGPAHDTTPPTVDIDPMVPDPSGAIRIPFGVLFSEPVTDLTVGDFSVSGSSAGWTVESLTGTASDYQVAVVQPPGGPPDEGTVVLGLAADAVTDLAAHAGPTALVEATANYVHDATPPTVLLYQTPHKTTSNAEFFDWTATFSEPVLSFEVPDVQLGGPDGSGWSIRRIFGGGATYSFSTDQAILADGTFTVQIPAGAMTDLAGNAVEASNKVTLVVDRSAPSTTTPLVSLRADTTLKGGDLRVNLGWSGTDVGPAGIASYDVARSFDGGAFSIIAGAISTQTLDWALQPGHTYQFEVRARDKAGNLGAWKVGPLLKPSLVQQTSSAIHFSGSSTTTSYSLYSGGSQRYLGAAGAFVTYTTTARSLSFVTTVGPNRGSAKVYLDGVLQATLDLNDPATTYRFVAFSKTWSSLGTHTIKVVSVGVPVPRVDVDAFGVIR